MNYTIKGLRRPISEKVDITRKVDQGEEVTGYATRVVGYELFDVELVLDLETVAKELGRSAGSNKSGKAVAMSGLIKAYARNRRREP